MEAAGRFARGGTIKEIARDLRVAEGSVRRWHRAWRDGGEQALRSKGPVSREKLSPQQWARLELELRKGPLAHGFAAGDAEPSHISSTVSDGLGQNNQGRRCGQQRIGAYCRGPGMPPGGAWRSSHTGLPMPMISPVELRTWIR